MNMCKGCREDCLSSCPYSNEVEVKEKWVKKRERNEVEDNERKED